MTEQELMTWLLQQIDFRKGDDWSHPCCSDCGYNAWHRRPQWYTDDEKCQCPCHQVRGHLGIADDLAPVDSEGRQAWRLEFGE